MGTIKKAAKDAMTKGRDTAVRVGKVAKSAAVAGAKAGAAAAIAAGTVEAERSWKETSPSRKSTRNKMAAALGAAAAIGAAGVVIANSRRKK